MVPEVDCEHNTNSPLARSLRYTCCVLMVRPSMRLGVGWKATYLPSPLMEGLKLKLLPAPRVETGTSLISPVSRSLRKTWTPRVVVPSMRLLEVETKATYLPSALMEGLSLLKLPMTPEAEVEQSRVSPEVTSLRYT